MDIVSAWFGRKGYWRWKGGEEVSSYQINFLPRPDPITKGFHAIVYTHGWSVFSLDWSGGN